MHRYTYYTAFGVGGKMSIPNWRDNPWYKEAHKWLHTLWSKDKGDDYDKEQWKKLERAIIELARQTGDDPR